MEVHASDVDGCARRFHAVLVLGADTSGEPAKIGSAVHHAAAEITAMRETEPMCNAIEVGTAALLHYARESGMAPGSVLEAIEILERVLAPESRLSLWPDMGWTGESESRWGLVYDGDDFRYVHDPIEPCDAAGTMDLIQHNQNGRIVRIDDYKTVLSHPSPEDAYEAWQLRLYAFAALRRFPKADSVDVGFVLLRHGYRAAATLARGDPWETGVARRIRAVREERERILAADEFPEQPGPWCHYCPVMMRCEAIRAAAEMGAEVHMALPIGEAARVWLAAKALASRLERHVKGHAEASEWQPIDLGDAHGTVLGMKPVPGYEVVMDYDRTLARLRQLGMKPETEIEEFRFVARNHYASRVRRVLKALRMPPEIEDGLVEPITTHQFTTFVPEDRAPELTLEEIEARFDRNMG